MIETYKIVNGMMVTPNSPIILESHNISNSLKIITVKLLINAPGVY